MGSNKQPGIIHRYVLSELAGLKTDCAQLSNDVREHINQLNFNLNELCETLFEICNKATKERDEAVQRYQVEEARRRNYLNQLHVLKGNIRVVCRIRPVNKIDEQKELREIAVSRTSREIVRCDGKDFEFDEVFGPTHTNSDVFNEAIPMVESIFEGHHACIFAYGQTGSGACSKIQGTKTFLDVE